MNPMPARCPHQAPPRCRPRRLAGSAIVLLLLGLAAGAAAAAPATGVPPALAARTDSVFAGWDRTNSPGCALAVVKDGRIVYSRGYGMASLELGVPISPRTVFDLGSVSKQFTATCVHLLARDGRVNLDDPVRKYFPQLPDYAAQTHGRAITLRHLLHHTSGLRDYNDLMILAGHYEADRTTKQQALDIIFRQKALNFEPGSRFLYSNTGYFLLSALVEQVSGQSLRDFAAARVFEPLGMTHTQFNDRYNRIIPGRAAGYGSGEAGFANYMSDWEQTGDGSVFSTVEDLATWAASFETGALAGPALVDSLQAPGRLNDGTPITYASGLDNTPWHHLRAVRHNGAWAGYRADLLRLPEQHMAFICLCNLADMNPSLLNDRVAEAWLPEAVAAAAAAAAARTSATPAAPDGTEGLETMPTVPQPAAELSRFVGRYQNAERGLLEVALSHDTLSAGGSTIMTTPLRPVGGGRFARAGGRTPILFVAEGGGVHPPARITLHIRGATPAGFTFERLAPWEPTPAALRALENPYYSDELAVAATFRVADGVPQLALGEQAPMRLEALTVDTFTCDFGEVRFRRDGAGRGLGFTLGTGRAPGIEFRRATRKTGS